MTAEVSAEVPAEPIGDGSGLTRNQSLIWIGQETSPGLPVFNELALFVFDGAIEKTHFDHAFQDIIDETEALRTVVQRVDGVPRARALDHLAFTPSFVDLSAHDEPAGALDQWARAHVDTMIDLSKRTFDSTLVKLSDTRFAWALLQHHICSDGASMAILFRRLGDRYAQLVAGETIDDQPTRPQFSAYLRYEDEFRRSERAQKNEAYWNAKLADPPDPVVFYGGQTLSPAHGLRRDGLDVRLGRHRSDEIRALARQKGVRFISDDLSVFSVFAAALNVYLFRLTGQERIAIGVPWHNRTKQFAETVGLLMEQDPFYLALDPSDAFTTVTQKVHKETLRCMRHLPYSAGNPGGRLYDVSLNYMKVSAVTFAGMHVEPHWHRPTFGDESMNLRVHDFSETGEISLSFDFNAELFAGHRDTAVAHFMNCLDACIDNPSQEIGSIGLLSPAERDRVVTTWNTTDAEFPLDRSVVGLFEDQVVRSPEVVAVACDGESLTYRELDDRSTRLAHLLVGRGVGRGALVGVCIDRSSEMLVAVMGVMKSGAGYVPLDLGFPPDRLAFMADDAGLDLVLTSEASSGLVPDFDAAVVSVDGEWGEAAESTEVAAYSPGDVDAVPGPDDAAYVLYTSGSTGRPKGVVVPHRALTNLLCSMAHEPGCGSDDVLLAVTTLSFDIAGLELYLPLITGGRVVLASRQVAADGVRLGRLLESSGATVMQATPATWRMLIDAGWTGTPGLKALCGGEGLPAELAAQLLDRVDELWNMYGPTETTIWSSVRRIGAGDEITIGRPIANTEFFVVDEQLQPVPIGVPGELVIGGAGLADGYLNRPELTSQQFVAHPFSDEPGARVYRTGDQVRYRDDGQVVHMGRLDDQVKVRGFRIELGEVEARLDRHPSVDAGVVVARHDETGNAFLAAYVVATPGTEPTVGELRRFLQTDLPDYMVPTAYVVVDEFPLTPNGKIDRRALPEPDNTRPSLDSEYAAPRTATEHVLVEIWQELLGVERVGINDNFFDLGGHSLLALDMINRIYIALHVEIPLQSLFEDPTVATVSAQVDRTLTPNAGQAARRRPSLAVCLHPGSTGHPLFLVHAGGGYVFFYRALAEILGRSRPVYGIRAEMPNDAWGDPFEQADSIETVASRYIAEIKSVQPEGPYALGGACVGGLIAFEMARQLHAGGEETVGPVLVFDSVAHNNRYLDAEDEKVLRRSGVYPHDFAGARLWWRISRKLREARRLNATEGAAMGEGRSITQRASRSLEFLMAPMSRRARELGWRLRGSRRRSAFGMGEAIPTSGQQMRSIGEAHDAAVWLSWMYRPRPLTGRIACFEAVESGPYHRSWHGLATEGVQAYDLPGTHLEMLEQPFVATTASLVEECLRQE